MLLDDLKIASQQFSWNNEETLEGFQTVHQQSR